MRRGPLLGWFAAGAVLVAGAVWAGNAWRTQAAVARVVESLPGPGSYPAVMRELIQDARAHAGSRGGAVRGLAELSAIHHANGHNEEARQCYAALEVLDPGEPRWRYRHALLLSGMGDAVGAEHRFAEVVRLAPAYAPARVRWGEVLLKQGNLAGAADAFLGVLGTIGNDPHALAGAARCRMEEGRWQEALGYLERAMEASQGKIGYDLIVTVYEKLQMPAKARAVRAKGKFSAAYRDMDDPWMEELWPYLRDPFQLSLAAATLKDRGDLAGAVALLQRAIELAPRDATLQFQRGIVEAGRGDRRAALAAFEACTRLDPTFADGWAWRSSIHEMLGDEGASVRVLEEGLAACPESPGLHLMRAKRRVQAGRLAEAVADYRVAVRLRPNDADPFIELAMTLFKAGEEAEGLAAMQRALDAEPDHPLALTTLTYAAIQAGDEAATRRWLDRIRDQPRVKPEDARRLESLAAQTFHWVR
jgi:tetratricopeptide (TPR) repeat protein